MIKTVFYKFMVESQAIDSFMKRCQSEGLTKKERKQILEFAKEYATSHPITIITALTIGLENIRKKQNKSETDPIL